MKPIFSHYNMYRNPATWIRFCAQLVSEHIYNTSKTISLCVSVHGQDPSAINAEVILGVEYHSRSQKSPLIFHLQAPTIMKGIHTHVHIRRASITYPYEEIVILPVVFALKVLSFEGKAKESNISTRVPSDRCLLIFSCMIKITEPYQNKSIHASDCLSQCIKIYACHMQFIIYLTCSLFMASLQIPRKFCTMPLTATWVISCSSYVFRRNRAANLWGEHQQTLSFPVPSSHFPNHPSAHFRPSHSRIAQAACRSSYTNLIYSTLV